MPQSALLIATRNPGKMREYRQLLRGIPFDLVSLDELRISQEVEETGQTFRENAVLKAGTYGALAGVLTLADDSGLEVDALGGRPGIYSSRYGAEPTPALLDKIPEHKKREDKKREDEKPADSERRRIEGSRISPSSNEGAMSDQDRVDLLLRNLEGVPWERRTARFRCVLAIAAPPDAAKPPPIKGGLAIVVGSVAGMIQYKPQGDEGFGYDPVFYLPSYGMTIAQLPLEEKNRISHRANATGRAMDLLNGVREFSA